ncbi:Chemoreceptor glutamine deamidase CheD [bioreactor metagenome]|uniref:Chemoreceptor glutamine deamidase CheD n=1 Tax=bioreactor metagenome TaxID=1076179 RepID=A0A645FF08_9ZZZZ
MFPALNNSAIANIGKRNIDAVREALGKLSIPIVADDTGKDYGRTLFFSAEDGSMRIKSASRGEWVW